MKLEEIKETLKYVQRRASEVENISEYNEDAKLYTRQNIDDITDCIEAIVDTLNTLIKNENK